MNPVRKFLRLQPADRRLLIRSVALVSFIRGWLWLAPYRPLHRLLNRLATKTSDNSKISKRYPERAAWAVNAASHRIPGARTCLVEALALEFILQRHGFPADLRLGVCHDPQGRVRAHAWVECDGKIVMGETDLKNYQPLTTLKGVDP